MEVGGFLHAHHGHGFGGYVAGEGGGGSEWDGEEEEGVEDEESSGGGGVGGGHLGFLAFAFD